MEKNHLKSPSIYLHVVVAMFIIQLLHKIVREIPGSLEMGGPGGIITILFAISLIVAIILTLFRKKAGLIIGIINGAWMIFQPILVHIIMGHPDQNGIWWSPVFPWTQAILIIYFSILTLKQRQNKNGQ
jgi:hypothetical protein